MTVREAGLRRAGGWSLVVDWILLLTIGALVAHQLFVPPIVGVADQGDYTRVMHPLGLGHVGVSYEDTVFLWVQPRYRVVPSDTSLLLPSTELLLAGLARGIDALFTGDEVFDLRLLGAVHLACYLCAIGLVLRGARTLPGPARAVVWLGLLLATPDVAYVACLNSFYSEPAALIFLLAVIGIALPLVRAEAPTRWGTWAYFVCAAMFAVTKVQNYALALPLISLPVVMLAARAWRRTSTTVLLLAALLLVLVLSLFARLPDVQGRPARWNAVFYGLLINSPSPSEDLAELGLDPELARWTGVPAIEVDGQWVEAPVMEVGGRYGFREIGLFYLRHPGRLVGVATLCAQYAFSWRNPLLGNYTRESGRPGSAHAPSYTGWSDAQALLFPKRLWFLAAFFGLFIGGAAWELRKGLDTPGGRTALVALTMAVMAIMAFAILVLAGGIEDPVTDLFMFQVLFDVCFVISLAWVATYFAKLAPVGGAWRSALVPAGGDRQER